MRIWKQNLFILLFTMIMLVFVHSVSAAELDDVQGDVYHHAFSDGTWSWTTYAEDKPNVDIDKVTYSVSGTTLTVTLELYGDIQESTTHVYSVIYNSSGGIYTFSYVNGVGTAIGIDEGGFITGQFTKSGNILTGTIEITEEDSSPLIWGVAAEYLVDYSTIVEQSADLESIEYYTDYVPGSLAPWFTQNTGDGDGDTGDGDTGDGETSEGKQDGGTPGFELITLIAAIAIAFILIRKK
jgi:hypothetical protein